MLSKLQGWRWGPLGHQAGPKTFTLCPAAHLLSGDHARRRAKSSHASFRSLPQPASAFYPREPGAVCFPLFLRQRRGGRAWLWAPLCVNSSQQREDATRQAAGKALFISHATDAFGGRLRPLRACFHSCYVRSPLQEGGGDPPRMLRCPAHRSLLRPLGFFKRRGLAATRGPGKSTLLSIPSLKGETMVDRFRENVQDVLPALPNPDDYFLLRWLRVLGTLEDDFTVGGSLPCLEDPHFQV
ncbi:PREDICTED: uncharacterized protein LOC104980232 [Bison bison bison]|uniref:Uncharacterized protein LOC104980232 n=1 Tax=Bison bison bison TaxID=43346 RepID=A0A6P3G5Y6_BISBB|nr:PREDICTED: uncharacterized protein LOC104980232 [Bison bison bison]